MNSHGWPGRHFRAISFWLALVSLPVSAQTHHDLKLSRELALGGAGIATWTAGRYLVLEKPVDPLVIQDRSGVPGIDRVALDRWSIGAHTASDILLGATVVASLAVTYINQKGEQRLVPATILMETGLITVGFTSLVKHSVARPRPYLYEQNVPLGERPTTDGLVSFWSGHTAAASAAGFACANLVQRSDASKGLKTATWIGASVLPVAVGFYRVRSGRHFPTDVLTGYAFGALAGWAVPYFHRAERKRPLVE
jgi:membrane-associated phospholipid phosphatase